MGGRHFLIEGQHSVPDQKFAGSFLRASDRSVGRNKDFSGLKLEFVTASRNEVPTLRIELRTC